MEKFPVIDLHPIIQGEGAFMGTPMIMIRVSGCNLSCVFSNSICDTSYSSFNPEKGRFSLEDVDQMIKKYPQIYYISLSGGEPGLYTGLIVYLKENYPNHFLLVETNGTIKIDADTAKKIDFASISPKLEGSAPTKEKCEKLGIPFTNRMMVHDAQRFNLDALMSWIQQTRDFQLKYVVGDERDLAEVKEQVLTLSIADYVSNFSAKEGRAKLEDIVSAQKLPEDFNTKISAASVSLMPAGVEKEQLEETRGWLMEKCIELGYNYSDRLHIVAFGNERER